jgi:hypothetical protein
MILFVHAAAVSLAATQAGIGRLRRPLAVRHALVTDLVDPRAMNFAGDDVDYARIRVAVAAHLRGGESRVVLSCSVYNGFAARLTLDLALPVERSDDAGARRALEIRPLLEGNAFAYADDAPRYSAALLDAVAAATNLDAVFLAQFSMDPYAPRIGEALNIPVISALEATLARLLD